MSTKTKTSTKPKIASHLFSTMTPDDLKAVAASLSIPTPKSLKTTLANLETAIAENKAHVKAVFTISFKPDDGSAPRKTHFGKTLRSYVSGQGESDNTWLMPANAVSGSPAEPADSDET